MSEDNPMDAFNQWFDEMSKVEKPEDISQILVTKGAQLHVLRWLQGQTSDEFVKAWIGLKLEFVESVGPITRTGISL